MGFSDVDSENKPVSFQQTFENKRSNHLQELQQKEDEMRQMFVVRVKEKEAELKESEKDVNNINTFLLLILYHSLLAMQIVLIFYISDQMYLISISKFYSIMFIKLMTL